MAFSWQSIRYGWVALASLVITGTTIYVVDNQRKQILPVDIIEIVLGTHERCMATKYSNIPEYYVSPLYDYKQMRDTNGVLLYVTNAIGWTIDRSLMMMVDQTIFDLIPNFVDPVTWAPDMNSFGTPLTVAGLFSRLNIGNGVDQFTRTPALGSNSATYGTLPWQIYEEDLVERYKVLQAMKWTVDNQRQITNDSWYGMISYASGATRDFVKYTYSNLTTHALVDIYHPSWEAVDLGENSDWEFYHVPTQKTNDQFGMINTNLDFFASTNVFLTWSQVRDDLIEDTSWGYGDWGDDFWGSPTWGDYTGWIKVWDGDLWPLGGYVSNSVYTRWHELDTRRTESLSSDTVSPGTFAWAYKSPYGLIKYVGTDTWTVWGWNWSYCYYTGYATWLWYAGVTSELSFELVGVFAIGGFQQPQPSPNFQPVGVTENYNPSSYEDWYANYLIGDFDIYWDYPREWQIDTETDFTDLTGLAATNYVKLSVKTAGSWLYHVFGEGRAPVADLASIPPHPDEPLHSTPWWNNAGSKGTAKGILVNEAYIVKDWTFNYCTDEYW